MKLCLACDHVFEHTAWACPACQWVPPLVEGFHAFSPELANANDGMPEDVHHALDQLQEKSFWFRGRNQLIQDAIKRYFPQANNVMEIGCGSGFVLSGIRKVLPEAHLTATEIYSHGLGYAAQRITPPHQFLQVDARHLPFHDEFDLIGAFDVLEHIEEDDQVVANLFSALKPGGGVMITVPQHPWLWSKADDMAFHKRRYTRHQLSGLLREHGFEVLLDTSFMFFLLPVMYLQRLLATRKEGYQQTRDLALPAVIDGVFAAVLGVEKLAIKLGARFPIGGSRLVVASRKSVD